MSGPAVIYTQIETELCYSGRLFRDTFEYAGVGIAHVAIDGSWLRVNRKLCEILNYHPDELLMCTFQDITHPDDLALDLVYIQEMLEDKRNSYSMRKRYVRRDGSVMWANLTVALVRDEKGLPDYFISVIEDISRLIETETALQAALEREKELHELKTRFVEMASHEFRTPIATVWALTDSLRFYRHQMDDAKIDQRMERIQTQLRHLVSMMDDVLLLSEMQADKLEFAPRVLDFNQLCCDVINECQTLLDDQREITYQGDPALTDVWLDSQVIQQLLNNLLSNAIKYSPPEQPIMLRSACHSNTLILTVQDRGMGIPERDLPHLFEPFHRGSNVRMIAGTGLGLTLVKESVTLHGGMISVESQLGSGSTFCVTIPLQRPIER